MARRQTETTHLRAILVWLQFIAWDLLVRSLGPRVERQAQGERLLPRCALGSLQCLGDARRSGFLSSQCLQGPT